MKHLYIAMPGLLVGVVLLWAGYHLLPWSGSGKAAIFSHLWLVAVFLSIAGFGNKYIRQAKLKNYQKNWKKQSGLKSSGNKRAGMKLKVKGKE